MGDIFGILVYYRTSEDCINGDRKKISLSVLYCGKIENNILTDIEGRFFLRVIKQLDSLKFEDSRETIIPE